MADYTVVAADVGLVSLHNKKPIISRHVSGATVIAGQVVTLHDATNTAILFDATNSEHTIAGLALNSSTNGQPMTILEDGYVDIGNNGKVAEIVVGSGAVPGSLAPEADLTTGKFVAVLGYMETGSVLRVKITNTKLARG